MSKFTVFGLRCHEDDGGVFYVVMDADGTVKSFDKRPFFKDGVWTKLIGSKNYAIYNKVRSIPKGVDASKCIWDYDDVWSDPITVDNWKELSLFDVETADAEIKRLLRDYGFNRERKGSAIGSNIREEWREQNQKEAEQIEEDLILLFRKVQKR